MTEIWKPLLVFACLLGLLTGCGKTGETVTESQSAAVPMATREETQPVMESCGKLRIPYSGNQSWVRYVTEVSQLPDYEELNMFDEEYFKDHALVLVMETVSSGSVDVGIDRITVDGNSATVTLLHKMKGDFGTADMATWLLWAEVEQGLECQWMLENPALKPNAVTH